MDRCSPETIATARQRAVERSIQSAAMGRAIDYTLLLPRNIDSGRRFPVLYLLHGRGDDHRSWNTNTSVAAWTADLPLIVVMPDALKTRYSNTRGGGRYQDFFLDELLPHIDATLPTIATRQGRATAGLSMGGYGALRLALAAADRFAACAGLSASINWGEVDPETFDNYVDLLRDLYAGDGPAERAAYAADAIWPRIQRHLTGGEWSGPALYLACGRDDRHFPFNVDLQRRLSAANVPHTWAEDAGGHEWGFWDRYVRHAIAFVMLHLDR